MNFININDLESRAKQKLPKMIFDYYAGGSHDQITLNENTSAYSRISLQYKVLVDVSIRNQQTSVINQQLATPILVAPMAFQQMCHSDGELATARAAAQLSIPMIVSTLSNCSIEEIRAASTGPLWFQLYVFKDRQITRSLVQRAEAANYSALVLTVDLPATGRRELDILNCFQLPEDLMVKNLLPNSLEKLPKVEKNSRLAAYMDTQFDPSITWADVEWLCSITKLPILLKGIIRADDAIKALNHGVSGIIVSNHGGRQLDTAPATITILPQIIEAVNGKIDVLIDGGIRRGTDIVKALAIGAKAVLIGRPILWGLATDGQQGVTDVLKYFSQDLDLVMALCGCPTIKDLSIDLLCDHETILRPAHT